MTEQQFRYCGLNVALKALTGKWKPVVLFHLFHNADIRSNELWRVIPKVSKKVLLEQLRQMEDDGLILREERHHFPPEVYYRLSEKGKALGTALVGLEAWANEHAPAQVADILAQEKHPPLSGQEK
ncbi:winged helix-turn-helix transcriptional regulator [Taibaiella koreensis]|uniref:winged helix-turn-helix transcriptional regulator n=1 Tax=Taibaiella koreensis TaxID=1268548 RepID=UPI000E59AD07|nr:helix-turn-helix domain-containing protein [Taibaiella koreensis]